MQTSQLTKIGNNFIDLNKIVSAKDFGVDFLDKYKITFITDAGVEVKVGKISRHEVTSILEKKCGRQLIDYKTDEPI